MFANNNFPNFNVPPPDMGQSITNKIENFLKTRQHIKNESVIKDFQTKITLQDAKHALNKLICYKNDLSHLSEGIKLISDTEATNKEWQLKFQRAEDLKSLIKNNLDYLEVNKTAIQKLINKRRKKRMRIKKRCMELKKSESKSFEIRKKKHEEIDAKLKKERERMMEVQKAEEHKEETKNTLASISKRISEAEEKLRLFDSLIELRKIRKTSSQNQDDSSHSSFIESIQQMKEIWMSALNKYYKEKEQLETYLKEKFLIQNTTEQQWLDVIFGENSTKKQGNPLLTAEKNLPEFIEVRRQWDACIVPDDEPTGSTIPIFWVLPNANLISDDWSKYKTTLQ